MPVEKKDLEQALTSKLGCKKDPRHHIYFLLFHEDKMIARFKTSHSKKTYKTIDDSGLANMIKGLPGVDLGFFKGFVRCTHSGEDLKEKILDGGTPPALT